MQPVVSWTGSFLEKKVLIDLTRFAQGLFICHCMDVSITFCGLFKPFRIPDLMDKKLAFGVNK
jgi:hypothetical protein